MSLKKLLGSCANGIKVFDRPNSHSNVHSVSTALIKEALLKISPNENFVVEIINFNRIIGKTNCVSIDKTDTIVMAYRHGRKGPTPMVLNREPEDCSSLTVILKKDHNSGNYILITAFFGDSSEKEPWGTPQ